MALFRFSIVTLLQLKFDLVALMLKAHVIYSNTQLRKLP